MTHDDLPTFAALMMEVGLGYSKSMTEKLLEWYWQALKSYSLNEVSRAIRAHRLNPASGRFMPTPADLAMFLEGDPKVKALYAWAKVMAALRMVGVYDTVVFDDCLIHAVIEAMGGWIVLCGQSVKELNFIKHEFNKRYEGYCYKPPTRYPNCLRGLIEHQNAMNGIINSQPTIIGDKSQAQAIYQSGSGQFVSITKMKIKNKLCNQTNDSSSVE